MRAGDTVYHRPSKETWMVAYVEGNNLAWYGWPPGIAWVSDCDLIRACTDEEHESSLRAWCDKAGLYDPKYPSDHRSIVCARQLHDLLQGYVGAYI